MLSISVLNLNITGKLYIPNEKDKKRNTIKQAIIVYVYNVNLGNHSNEFIKFSTQGESGH